MPSAPPDLAFLAHLRATLAALFATSNSTYGSGRWSDEAGRALGALVGGTATVTLVRTAAPSPAAADGVPDRASTRVEVAAAAGSAAEARVVCRLRSPADADRVRAILDALAPALAAAAMLRVPRTPAVADGILTPPRPAPAVPRTSDLALRAQFGLTARQLEVVALLLRGRRNADIAAALGTSSATARHHTERVLAKLGARSRAEVPGIVATRLAAIAAAAPADGPQPPTPASTTAVAPALADAP